MEVGSFFNNKIFPKGYLAMAFGVFFWTSLAFGQEHSLALQFQKPLIDWHPSLFQASKPNLSILPRVLNRGFQLSDHFLPDYAQQNPSGYSYLCRLELKIEDELPLGLWLNAGDADNPSSVNGNLTLKLKMLRF